MQHPCGSSCRSLIRKRKDIVQYSVTVHLMQSSRLDYEMRLKIAPRYSKLQQATAILHDITSSHVYDGKSNQI